MPQVMKVQPAVLRPASVKACLLERPQPDPTEVRKVLQVSWPSAIVRRPASLFGPFMRPLPLRRGSLNPRAIRSRPAPATAPSSKGQSRRRSSQRSAASSPSASRSARPP